MNKGMNDRAFAAGISLSLGIGIGIAISESAGWGPGCAAGLTVALASALWLRPYSPEHRPPEQLRSLKPQLKLAHRDDLPYEAVEEIERRFAESHPGMKVVFAGDMRPEDLPPEILASIAESPHAIAMQRSREEFSCVDCGVLMPNRPLTIAEAIEWEGPPEGWLHFTNGPSLDDGGRLCGWQCPKCDAEDDQRPVDES